MPTEKEQVTQADNLKWINNKIYNNINTIIYLHNIDSTFNRAALIMTTMQFVVIFCQPGSSRYPGPHQGNNFLKSSTPLIIN